MNAAARIRLPVTDAVVAERLESTATVTGVPPKPRKLCVTVLYEVPASVVVPCRGIGRSGVPGIVDASVRPPCRTTIATPGPCRRRAYSPAVSSETLITRGRTLDATKAVPGAIAVGSPMSIDGPEPPPTVTLASPACDASPETFPGVAAGRVAAIARAITW